METLAELHCMPMQIGEGRVAGNQLPYLHRQVPYWHVVESGGNTRLQRAFAFGTFTEALAFTERVGRVAQLEGHYPALLTEWGRAQVWWWTPELKGLMRNDFIMAAKTDREYLAMMGGSVASGYATWSSDTQQALGPD